MEIVTSALHGLLHMFQWLQHVIATNWLTIGDGLVLWIPDSHNSVSFNFPRMYRVAPTHSSSDIQTWHWNICYLSWELRLHTGYFPMTHFITKPTWNYQPLSAWVEVVVLPYQSYAMATQPHPVHPNPFVLPVFPMENPALEKIQKKLRGSPWKGSTEGNYCALEDFNSG